MAEQTRRLAPTTWGVGAADSTSEFRKTVHRLFRNKGAIAGAFILILIVLMAVFAPALAPDDPLKQSYGRVLQAPNRETLLGTDQFGRDILSRIIIGSRQSLQVAVLAILIASSIGTLLGLVTGFYGGWIDMTIQRLIDVQLAFPGILFALAVVAVLGPGLRNAMIAVGLSLIPSYARMVRGSVLSARENAYVDAARVLGAGDLRIL